MSDPVPRFCRHLLSAFRVFGLLLLLPGCGGVDSLPRQPVFGTISDSKERDGQISFVPIDGDEAPAARCAIRDGRYAFDSSNGPVPGWYRVVIQLEIERSDAEGGELLVKEVLIPAEAAGQMPAELEIMPDLEATVPDADQTGKSLRIDFVWEQSVQPPRTGQSPTSQSPVDHQNLP